MFDTIVAISSGLINQPISIIRLSGPDVLKIVKNLFNKPINEINKMILGFIIDQKQLIDEVLLTYFKAPHSFTGEDMIEIYAHGGIVNTQRILKLLLANGARHAERGEFSLRAVINQKIDLIKAEAIHDLIFAQTEDQANLSIKKFDKQTTKLITQLKNKLLNLIAVCETNIDYPEYDDIEVLTQESLVPIINDVLNEIDLIIESSKSSQFIFEGVNVAIIGKPNSGKSSLLNALLNQEKAIVSATAGTTRDVVEGKLQIGQVLLNLKDTAGIHQTNDEIEKQGIARSIETIQKADLIIHLFDAQDEIKSDDQINHLLQKLTSRQIYLPVINKVDLLTQTDQDQIYISALHNQLEPLIKVLNKTFPKINTNNDHIITNTRQLSLILKAKKHLEDTLKGLKENNTPDTVIVDLHKAWEALANVLGVANNETLLDEIFKSFCLGK